MQRPVHRRDDLRLELRVGEPPLDVAPGQARLGRHLGRERAHVVALHVARGGGADGLAGGISSARSAAVRRCRDEERGEQQQDGERTRGRTAKGDGARMVSSPAACTHLPRTGCPHPRCTSSIPSPVPSCSRSIPRPRTSLTFAALDRAARLHVAQIVGAAPAALARHRDGHRRFPIASASPRASTRTPSISPASPRSASASSKPAR